MSLQDKFSFLVNTLPHLPLPPKVLVIHDTHAGGGDDKDLLKINGNEPLIIDVLKEFRGKRYSLLITEVMDVWRGYFLSVIYSAHPNLIHAVTDFGDFTTTVPDINGELYRALGNHERDALPLPEAYIFEGFGKKIFFDHGYLEDWWCDQMWRVGREAVREADRLRLDSELSPHPVNPNMKQSGTRHLEVIRMRDELARNNSDWIFMMGHVHRFRYNEIDSTCPKNLFISGAAYMSPLQTYSIEEGNVILFERN